MRIVKSLVIIAIVVVLVGCSSITGETDSIALTASTPSAAVLHPGLSGESDATVETSGEKPAVTTSIAASGQSAIYIVGQPEPVLVSSTKGRATWSIRVVYRAFDNSPVQFGVNYPYGTSTVRMHAAVGSSTADVSYSVDVEP